MPLVVYSFSDQRGLPAPHMKIYLISDIVTPVTNSAQQRSLIGKIGAKAAVFLLKKIFSLPKNKEEKDLYYRLAITPEEAATGTEKQIAVKRSGKLEKLLVKIPPGLNPGTF